MEIFYLILKLETLIFHFHKCPCSTAMLDYGHGSNATFRVLFNMIKSHGFISNLKPIVLCVCILIYPQLIGVYLKAVMHTAR